jgi:hypothetical protein
VAQLDLAAATETSIVDGASKEPLTISYLHFCNRGGAAVLLRVRLKRAGEADNNKQFLLYDYQLASTSYFQFPFPIGLYAGDVLKVYSDLATVSVTAFSE